MPDPDKNFELLREAKKPLTGSERGEFDSYLIGSLMCRVTEQEWKEAIEIALKCCAEAKARRAS